MLLALCVVLGLAGGSARADGGAALPVVVTVASFAGSVDAVAQDGASVAWLKGDGRFGDCDKVAIENLVTHARTLITQSPINAASDLASCAHAGSAVQLALAGRRALWSSVDVGNSQYMTLWSGSSQQRTGRAILASTWNGTVTGGQLRGIAGNADTLVYAVSNWKAIADCPAAQLGTPCNAVAQPSPIRRVDQQGAIHDVPRSDVGYGVAAWGELVATVREGRIVVLRARTGAQVGSVAINGCCGKAHELEPTGIRMALASRTVALLRRRTINVYDWRSRRHLARVILALAIRLLGVLSERNAACLGNKQNDCHPRSGGCARMTPCNGFCAISVLDLSTGRRRVVARPKFDPFDVTIIGRRIVWGENKYVAQRNEPDLRPARGYVRMLQLPS